MDINTIKEYYDYYLSTNSIAAVSKRYNKCTKYLKRWFEENGFDYPLPPPRKHTLDERFFQNIDSEIKAYLLGFIYADGCIHTRKRKKEGNSYALIINLKAEDIEILNLFKNSLNYGGEFYYTKGIKFTSPSNNKEYTRNDQVRLTIDSKVLVQDLINFGLDNRKTYMNLSIPNIDDKLVRHFVRGYFDGDGCLSWSGTVAKKKSYKSFVVTVSFTSKNSSMLESLKLWINSINCKFAIRLDKTRDCFIGIICNKQEVERFLDTLYINSNYFLNRKYKKYVQLKSGEFRENLEVDNPEPSLS